RWVALVLDNARLYQEAQEEIKERTLIEVALKNQQERLELSQKAARIGSFEWNIQTDEVFWSPEAEVLFGKEPGAFGKNFNYWTKIVHPDDLVVVRKEMEAAIQKHEEFDTEFRVITPEYGTHWLACRGKVFYDG